MARYSAKNLTKNWQKNGAERNEIKDFSQNPWSKKAFCGQIFIAVDKFLSLWADFSSQGRIDTKFTALFINSKQQIKSFSRMAESTVSRFLIFAPKGAKFKKQPCEGGDTPLAPPTTPNQQQKRLGVVLKAKAQH